MWSGSVATATFLRACFFQNSLLFAALILLALLLNTSPVDAISEHLNDECSVSISGGLESPRSNRIRTVELLCERGTLIWNEPQGSLLVRFPQHSVMEGSGGEDSKEAEHRRLCMNFSADHDSTPGITITRMVGTALDSDPIDLENTSHKIAHHCSTIDQHGSTRPLAFLIKGKEEQSTATTTATTTAITPTISLHYDTVSASMRSGTPPGRDPSLRHYCGSCDEEEFRKAFCSQGNFVFKGRLLGQGARGNALEYSVESIVKEPTPTGMALSRVHPKSGIRTTTLQSHCPKGSIRVPGLHSEFVAIAQVGRGEARLLCTTDIDQFDQWKQQSSEKITLFGRTTCELENDADEGHN